MLDTMLSRPQSLFDQLDAVQRLLSRSLGAEGAPGGIRSVAYGAFPEINVGRTPSSVEVFAFAPGIDASSLDVTIERNVLKISGTRRCSCTRTTVRKAASRAQSRFPTMSTPSRWKRNIATASCASASR